MQVRRRVLFATLSAFLVSLLAFAADPQTAMVAMRDGVKLATDVYLPDGDGPFPVVLTRSYYGRGGGKDFNPLFAKTGVAFVIQDERGRGDSEGEDRVFTDDGWGKLQDGEDTIRWVREQKWCNGKVGTFGMSALAITQLLTGGTGVPLDCQVVWAGAGNFYGELSYTGGVFLKNMIEGWTEACKNTHIVAVWKEHPAYDNYWRNFNSDARANKVKAPVLHIGGWWDIFAQGTLDSFETRQHHGGKNARGNQRLVMGAWSHGGAPNDKVGEFTLNTNWKFDFLGESGKFLDHWLQGGPSDLAAGPPVRYYTVGAMDEPNAPGNEWRTADDWPPFKTTETAYFLAPEGKLVTSPVSKAPALTYVFDPADPCPTKGGPNLLLPAGPFDQSELAKRADVLSFATEPLDAPVEITGRVTVRLFISSDAPDTDFTAKLLDIYPDGRAMGMLDGIRRVKFRKGFKKADPLKPRTIGQVDVDLWSISLIFNKGHRIGLQVSSSNYPRFELNPNTGEDFPSEGGELRKAVNAVYLDAEHPSALLLPVPVGER